ncbi:MAG: pseudouridine synthase [Dehalococcoidia bacterium]|nr:pseudouridine synthase [Dehalococcoidia bacterium]
MKVISMSRGNKVKLRSMDEFEEIAELDYTAILPPKLLAVPSLLTFVVPREYAGLRLDQALVKLLPEYSRSRLQAWVGEQQVKIDGATATPKYKVWGGEIITVMPQSAPSEQPYLAEDIALNILFEDDSILVINKPAGLVVHPGSGNWQGTMLNALLHHAPQLTEIPRAGIVHRLDKDTSGLLVVAKTLVAQTSLVRQLQKDLELVSQPFGAQAQAVGLSENELLEKAGILQRHGVMRRFAAVLHHRKAGFAANAMGIWIVPLGRVEEVGKAIATFPQVTHCYERPTYPDWPYNLFSMIHSQTPEGCHQVAQEISRGTGVTDFDLLFSTKEYKKARVKYFED